MTDFFEEYAKRRQHLKTIIENNTRWIFQVLQKHGIAAVFVNFDGEGDSGQIDEIRAHSTPLTQAEDTYGHPLADLPQNEKIFHTSVDWKNNVSTEEVPLERAVEGLVYMMLEIEHAGWENNEGSFGDFLFDVPKSLIIYTHHTRISETVTDSYEY